MEMISVLCCIQARCGSKRLPEKVIKKINGEPLITHIIRRLKKCRDVDKIVLATSRSSENDILEKIAVEENIDVSRGPEDDVLERFHDVSEKYGPDHIVRVCADNPLIDPVEVDRIIRHHIARDADYSFNHIPGMGNNYPDGIGAEIFKKHVLEKIKSAATSNEEKEHINEYVWNNMDEFHIETLSAPEEIAYPSYRFDVDTREDLDFIRWIYGNLCREAYPCTGKIIEFLERHRGEGGL